LRNRHPEPPKPPPSRCSYNRYTPAAEDGRRAKDQHITISDAIEAAILENIMVPEVERMMKRSPEFARIAKDWMQSAKIRRT
jgi:hypothetical protein